MFAVSRYKIVLLCVGVLLVLCLPANASKLSTMKDKQKQLHEKILDKKQEIKEKQQQYDATLEHLQNLEEKITNVQGDLDTLKHKLNITEKELEVAEQELTEEENKLQERTKIFRDRLVEVYLNGQVSYLEVILSSTSMHDFLVRMDLMSRLVEQDLELVQEIDTRVKEVEEKKKQIEDKRAYIAGIKKETEQKEVVLKQQTEEKKILLGQIEEDKKNAERALNELEQESKQIAEQIRRIQAASKRVRHASRGNGRFEYPVPGYYSITSPFGWRIHPILKTRRMHTGVDFGAPMGAAMVAADDGTVIYTGWYGAYGQVVIIDHGSNISTMYAHMSSISVSEGENVKAGQRIGSVGSTGWSTGPHAHFEVRINGEPVNPMQYLQ